MTLDEIMDCHVAAVKVQCSLVAPHEDIIALLGAWRGGKLEKITVVELSPDRKARWMMHDWAMQWLRVVGAEAYTYACAMWMSGLLSPDELKAHLVSGRGVADRDDRAEVIMCIAGDKDRTIHRDFDIIRVDGRICDLRERALPEGDTTGLFFDLLLTAKGRLQ